MKDIWEIFRLAGSAFLKDKVPKLSASLAFYTIFALAPMLIVVIYLSNLFWRQQAIEGIIYQQTKDLIGPKAAFQIQEIIKNISVTDGSSLTGIIGFVTLLIGATTIFADIQDSINSIWKLKIRPEKGWLIMLKNRLISFSLVVSMSFLLLVSLVINGLVEGLMESLNDFIPQMTIDFVYYANLFITFLITTLLFSVIFKVLPDAVIQWKGVGVGAAFTAALFMLGRFGIAFYLGKSNPGNAYGTAGSLVILMLWVYFSSIILYFGAEFTKLYALKFGTEIRPKDYAVSIQSNKRSLRENEDDTEKTERELQKAKDNLDSGSNR